MAIALHRPERETRSFDPLPLEPGDNLDRATFHERYEAMPPGLKAELIDGVVYMPSPAKNRHGTRQSDVVTWLGVYAARTPGVSSRDNVTVILSEVSEPQPDASLIILPECGGQTSVSQDDWATGAPELVVEVASSSAAYDLHQKKWMYEAAGTCEYVTVLTGAGEVRWFVLRNRQYETVADEAGIYKSTVFPGLWLNAPALLAGDAAAVLATLEEGLASEEHAEFVARLAATRQ